MASKREMIEMAAKRMYEADGANFDPYPYSYSRSTWEQLAPHEGCTGQAGTGHETCDGQRPWMQKAQIAWDTFAEKVIELRTIG